MQTSHLGRDKDCDVCDNSYPDKSHPPEFMIDYQKSREATWWQSKTMEEDVHNSAVNITINLGNISFSNELKLDTDL